MILEALSLKKKCFFVNPDDSGSAYFSYHDFDKYFYLNSYEDFCKRILFNIKTSKNENLNYDRMCLESSDVSDKIYKILMSIRNRPL